MENCKQTHSIEMAAFPRMEGEFPVFSKLIYEVLKEYTGLVLTKGAIQSLLVDANENSPSETSKTEQTEELKNSHRPGYPSYPLYTTISRTLYDWMVNGIYDAKNPKLLEECKSNEEKRAMNEFVEKKLKACLTTDETCKRKQLILEILESIKLRGILDLLGMKETVGSVDKFPPSLLTLWESFGRKHTLHSKLSCGARALSKHCHRDSTSQWWGVSTGTEGDKNEHANQNLARIFDNAVWINIHRLPHDVEVLEVRTQLGYGARWSCDGTTFRGFLEPQMSDGHSIGWKH